MKKIALWIFLFSSLNAQTLLAAEEGDIKDLIPASEIETEIAPVGRDGDWLFRCFADNPYGVLFSAVDWDPRVAQDLAMYRCFHYPPGLCRPLGCRREY